MPVTSLKDVYVAELRDLWSANDQMQRIMTTMGEKASDPSLKTLFQNSVAGIGKHTEALRSLVEAQGGQVGAEHCRGMEGLVEEAKKHAIEADMPGRLRDLVLISQYQRMSHYGLAGFGTAASYAKALGLADEAAKLKSITGDIYKADEYTTHLAEATERAAAGS